MGDDETETDDAVEVTVPASDQQRDWYGREGVHRNPDLIISFRMSLTVGLTPEVCRSVADKLIRRHGALRTSFATSDGVVYQRVHRDLPDRYFWHEDLRRASGDERAGRYAELVRRERGTGFDLGRVPLVRVGLIRMSDDHAVVSMTMHHIVADGWAVDILRREFVELLAAELAGQPDQLPPAMQCHEWSEAERRWAAGAEAAGQLEHWGRTLAPVRPLAVPVTRKTDQVGWFDHAEIRVPIGPRVDEKLRAAARTLRATAPMLTLSAYLKLLSTVTGLDTVATLTMVTGRSMPGYDTVVGSLTNVLTVHVEGALGRTAAELVPQLRDRLVAAYAHQRIFVSRVWDRSHLDPGDVDSLFIFDAVRQEPSRPGPVRLAVAPQEPPRSFRRQGSWWENFKLRYIAAGDESAVTVEYNANMFDEDFIRSFVADYLECLGTL
ncbi:condensation domain-containing protein [Micromonospora echinofusca]|uniref:condensation domain-containing protein n=1 Tax=Micromonospora echinofusca TaxID=47858 RepID=UPI0033F1D6CF